MKTVLLLACVLSAAVLLPSHALAAGAAASFSYDLAVVGGGGQLEDSTTFSVSVVSFVADTANRHISFQNGSLILDSVSTECTIDSVATGCSQATLLCEDVFHELIPAGPGGFHGSIDGVAVTTGRILLLCKQSPSLSR